MRTRHLIPTAALVVVALTAAGCSGSSDGGSRLDVSLRDFALTVAPSTVPAGTVTLRATSDGPSVHEFEVFEVTGDVDPDALPVEDAVAVTEGLTLLDEVEDLVPGSPAELTLDLEPGTYAVICNLPGHYEPGMHATFTVT